MATKRWYQEATEGSRPLGWKKDMSREKRIGVALRSRRGNVLATARALNALANVTTDYDTRVRARADAAYLYGVHRRQRK